MKKILPGEKKSSVIKIIQVDGKLCTNNKKIANAFNMFFTSAVTRLRQSLDLGSNARKFTHVVNCESFTTFLGSGSCLSLLYFKYRWWHPYQCLTKDHAIFQDVWTWSILPTNLSDVKRYSEIPKPHDWMDQNSIFRITIKPFEWAL